MKLLFALSLLCIHTGSVPVQEKQKADTIKKVAKPKKGKATAPLYPSILLFNNF